MSGAAQQVIATRVWPAQEYTRVTFETAKPLRHRVNRGVILRRRNLEARGDPALRRFQLSVGRIEILERDLRCGVRMDARDHRISFRGFSANTCGMCGRKKA